VDKDKEIQQKAPWRKPRGKSLTGDFFPIIELAVQELLSLKKSLFFVGIFRNDYSCNGLIIHML